jgi:hypothetical protein
VNGLLISDLDFFDTELCDCRSIQGGSVESLLASLDNLKETIIAQATDEKSTKPVIDVKESAIKESVGQNTYVTISNS